MRFYIRDISLKFRITNVCVIHIAISNVCVYHIAITDVCVYHIAISNVCVYLIAITNVCISCTYINTIHHYCTIHQYKELVYNRINIALKQRTNTFYLHRGWADVRT